MLRLGARRSFSCAYKAPRGLRAATMRGELQAVRINTSGSGARLGSAVRAQRRADVKVESGWGQQDGSDLDSQGSQVGKKCADKFRLFPAASITGFPLAAICSFTVGGRQVGGGSTAHLFSIAACNVR